MFFIDETYFKGELTIPQLPTSYIGEDEATYGTALMIQTSAENNLYNFIDTKTIEWLTYMYGEQLAQELCSLWTAYLSAPTTKSEIIWEQSNPDVFYGEVIYETPYFMFDTFVPTGDILSDVTIGGVRTIGTSDGLTLVIKDGVNVKLSNVRKTDADKSVSRTYIVDADAIPNAIKGIISTVLVKKGNVKCSPIANYVYYWLNRDAQNNTTAMGEADLNFSRANNAYEADKFIKANAGRNRLIRAWNDMVAMNKNCIYYLRNHMRELSGYSFRGMNHELLTSTQNVFNI